MKETDNVELLKAAVKPLLFWFMDNSRILPWREKPSPYGTWLSEIMLQQTRVEAVIPYYYRFMERFPDIKALAEADEDEVFGLWQGLGYYRRGSLLLQGAKKVVADFGGELPKDYALLLSLPGIGEYTAGAIASIGFGLPYPAVDGNVLRVISRLLGSYENIADEKVKKNIKDLLTVVIPEENPGDFNQSLMELGALICIPNGAPKCKDCPLSHLCRGFCQGIAEELPKKEKKKPRRIEERTVFLLRCGKKVAIRKRSAKGLLANLWEYPNALGKKELAEVETIFSQGQIKNVGDAKHIFTHIEWHMVWYEIILEKEISYEDCLWVPTEELCQYAMASAFKKKLKESSNPRS